jgi:hypothetical protein
MTSRVAAAACAALVLLDLASLLALVLGLRCAHSGPLLTGGLGGCEPRRLGVSQTRLFELVEHKLDDAGHKPVLDMYEGMPHVFQDLSIPEAATAIGKSADFIRSQLG